jgi:adenine phosphoribosyltransferase
MSAWPPFYSVELVPGLTVELPLIRDPSTGFAFYSFNMLGRADWCEKTAQKLGNLLNQKLGVPDQPNRLPEIFVTAEAKAIALTQELARNLGHDRYVVLRKSKKSYMQNPVSFQGGSITSGNQEYWVEQADLDYLYGKRVALVDDVVSSGGTAETFLKVTSLTQCTLEVFCCVLTEGVRRTEFQGLPLVSLNHIPLPGVIPPG